MTIALLTESQPAQACMDALLTGRIVPDTQTGLAVQAPGGAITRVMWPFGYSARLVDDHLELLDASGVVVAAEGDAVEMGGGTGNGGLFYSCAGSVRRAS